MAAVEVARSVLRPKVPTALTGNWGRSGAEGTRVSMASPPTAPTGTNFLSSSVLTMLTIRKGTREHPGQAERLKN